MQRNTEGTPESRAGRGAGPQGEHSDTGTGTGTGTGQGEAPDPAAARTRRTQAERDADTVETGYALFSAGFATALVFGAVAGPALLFTLPSLLERLLPVVGGVAATAVFLLRVVTVLTPWGRRRGGAARGPEDDPA